ncbi:PorV/PorQ family protein [candidate division KSB1 bacterium]|nr:PorV/PorQ family protein [candidate division KSB1 bacterium]
MKTNRIFMIGTVLALCVLLIAAQVFAGTGKRKGTAGGQELLIPVGSVGTALGGANLANVSGLEAIYWNPAGLAASQHSAEVMFSHLQYIADVNVNYVAGNFKSNGFGALGVSIKSLSFGDIPVTTNASPDGTDEIFSPTFLTLGVTYSRAMTDRINFGASAKFLTEKIMRESATGMAFDFGLQYSTGGNFNFGVTLKNIGPNMRFDGGDLEVFTKDISDRPDTEGENTRLPLANFELPTSLEIGVSYLHTFNESNKFTLMGSFLNNNFALDEYRIGGEYNFHNNIFLRGSYVIGYDADGEKVRTMDKDNFIWGPSFGGGLNFDLGKSMNLSLDYAYRLTEIFEDNQWFTFKIRF